MTHDEILKLIPGEVITAALTEFAKADAIRTEGRAAAEQDRQVRAMLPKLRADADAADEKYKRDIDKAGKARIFGGAHEVPDASAVAIAQAAVAQAQELIRRFDGSGQWVFEKRASDIDQIARDMLAQSLLPELARRFDEADRLMRIFNQLAQYPVKADLIEIRVDGVDHKYLSPHNSEQRDAARQTVADFEASIRANGSQNATETPAAKKAA